MKVLLLEDEYMLRISISEFLEDMGGAVDAAEHMTPIDMAGALARMVADRDEIYLNADDALDPSAQIGLANCRARDRGPDIRDHPKYQLNGPDCTRTSLSPYWVVDGDVDNKIFTHISIVEVPDVGRCGKTYVSATLERHVLSHVLGRIRHFARPAP